MPLHWFLKTIGVRCELAKKSFSVRFRMSAKQAADTNIRDINRLPFILHEAILALNSSKIP